MSCCDEKFQLFSGVFGASDEVLGSIESGVDFEKRIAGIYQTCRTPEQIEFNFNALQQELENRLTNGCGRPGKSCSKILTRPSRKSCGSANCKREETIWDVTSNGSGKSPAITCGLRPI